MSSLECDRDFQMVPITDLLSFPFKPIPRFVHQVSHGAEENGHPDDVLAPDHASCCKACGEQMVVPLGEVLRSGLHWRWYRCGS